MSIAKNTFATIFFKYLLFITALWVILLSCSHNSSEQAKTAPDTDNLPPPHETVLASLSDSSLPHETFLEKSNPPVKVAIPSPESGRTGTSQFGGASALQLLPAESHSLVDKVTLVPLAPEVQGAGFFTTFTTDNGLALDAILCSIEDNKGNLWFGTAGGGISRYDGKYFVNYTSAHGLAYNTVQCIAEDNSGNLWFGTGGGGVSKYDGEFFVNYTTVQGLANNTINCITEDDKGILWFATTGGVSKYDGKTFTNYTTAQGLPDNSVWSITKDNLGNIWFGTIGGVSKYDGKSFVNYTTADGLASNVVICSMQDREGNLWFGLNGAGLSKYDGKSFVNYGTSQGLAGNKVVSILEDNAGALWFGTYGGGVSKYNGRSFVNFTTAQGLAGDVVASILEDKTGNLWFGIYGGGISKYSGKSFVNYTTVQGLANNVVRSIAEDKSGNLWFGTNGGGISKYNGVSFVNYSTAQGLANNLGYSITEDKAGNLWIGTFGGGVSKFDGKSFVNYTTGQGLAGDFIQCVTEDSKGNLWIGTSRGGASKFTGNSFINYTTTQGLADNSVQCVTKDKSGILWFGTNKGVTVFNGKSFVNYTIDQGLVNNIVNSITEDNKGNIWIGTEEGLNFLSNEKRSLITGDRQGTEIKGSLFETFTTQNGLPDNFITQVIQQDDNKLFVGTNLGICELDLVEPSKGNDKIWKAGKIFNTQTGYPVKDVNFGQHAMFKDRQGIIWIATGSDKTGLVRFDPGQVRLNTNPPVLVMQHIKINNESVSWSDLLPVSTGKGKIDRPGTIATQQRITEEITTFGKELSEKERTEMRQKFENMRFDSIAKWYPVPENLVLPHQHNNISFDFSAIDPGTFPLIKYQYMLDGYDKKWSPLSTISTAGFGNMFEGTYTFRVKAMNPDGVWSAPLSYSFKVMPPWWRTWWMYLVYLLTFLAALRVFSKWRERIIVEEKEKLEIKVKNRTEALNKSLNELKATQSQLIQSEKMASLGELTAGIAHEIQNPLNFVNNFSELNTELIDELNLEIDKGNISEVKTIANDIKENEQKINLHGKRAESIVKGMLQHSRSNSGGKEPTDINSLADEFLRLAYHGLRAKDKSFNTEMKTNFDESVGRINIIPQDIGRVILNLITNAFYAANEKKQQHPEGFQPIVSVSTKKIGDFVEIKVTDNGNGIPPKILDKIFQPFFTTKPAGQGTGLGLSMSYDVVKVHGGELKVETIEGESTTFIILLPLKS